MLKRGADCPVLVPTTRAVLHSVTELGPRHAAAASRAGQEVTRTGEIVTGGRLVTPVTAVVVTVTVEVLENTFLVTALYLLLSTIRPTLGLRLVSRHGVSVQLLSLPETVVVTITEPGLRDALVAVRTPPVV